MSRGNGTISVYSDYKGYMQVCVKDDRNVGSFGIFLGDQPLDFVLPVSLCQLFILISISRLLYFLLRPLKTPKFICNLVGGIILGPSVLGRSETYWKTLFQPRQAEVLILLSLIGAVYFLFFIALKMDVTMSLRSAKSTWKLGVIPFFASFGVISTLLNLYYNPPNLPPFRAQIARSALSSTMSFSNFPVVSDALIELNLIATELGQIALSSAMLNDNMLWCHVVITRFVGESDAKIAVIFLATISMFLAFCILILRPTMKLIALRTPVGKPVKEIYVVLILLGVLVVSGVGDVIGITFMIGPLIFGLMIPSGPPLGSTIVEKSEVIITEFLLPFFFLYIGLNTNLNSVLRDWKVFLTLQGIFIAGDIAKFLACVFVCLSYNIRPKHGAVLGLMLNVKGITELIAFARLRKLKMLDDETFSHMVFCVVTTTSVVIPLVRLLYQHRPRLQHSSSLYGEQARTIQSTPRMSEFRVVCCVHNEGNVRGMTSLLKACNATAERSLCAYVIHLIELLGKSSSILLPINYRHRQNKKFLSVNYPNTNHIIRAFENFSVNSNGSVTVIPYVNVAPYKSMHDAVCNLAQDNFVPFIVIPFHENDHIDIGGHVAPSIRKTNARFQAHAPCSSGLLVDRYSRMGACNTNLYFNVAIFFLGGADDREALALGIRMAESASTRVSLFRFAVMNRRELIMSREEMEREHMDMMLDEGLIDEFKSMKYGNGNVAWYEMVVEDVVGVLDAIHNLQGDYELVMVGRRHEYFASFKDEEMSVFMENAETLGIVGDTLSSKEFCAGMVPVLVIQCGGGTTLPSNDKLNRVGSVNVSQKSLMHHSSQINNVM